MREEEIPKVPDTADELIDKIDGVKKDSFMQVYKDEWPVLAMVAVPFAGVGYLATQIPEAAPQANTTTTIEKAGDHDGVVHISGPGEGVLNTKTGNFRITQNHQRIQGSIAPNAPTKTINKH